MRKLQVMLDGESITLDGPIAQAYDNGVLNLQDSVFFQRQLELIKAKSYDVLYPELVARTIFPVSNEGGPGIQTITYRTYDQVGAAKIINAYANDLPRADVDGKETSIPVRSIGISYGYNIDEINAARMVGMPLDQRRANSASKSNEQVVNDVAFYGDESSGLPGLFSNPNIPTGPAPTGNWANSTPEEISYDINSMFSNIFINTKMVERGNTLLLPPEQWSYISTTPRELGTDTTILQYVVNNSPFLNSISDVIPLNECTGGSHELVPTNTMVAMSRDPDKLQLEIPVELEFLPTQQKNLEFVVPGRSRLGGLNIYYPLSLSISTGI